MTKTEMLENKSWIYSGWVFVIIRLIFPCQFYVRTMRSLETEFLFISLVLSRVGEYIKSDQFKLPIWPFNLLSKNAMKNDSFSARNGKSYRNHQLWKWIEALHWNAFAATTETFVWNAKDAIPYSEGFECMLNHRVISRILSMAISWCVACKNNFSYHSLHLNRMISFTSWFHVHSQPTLNGNSIKCSLSHSSYLFCSSFNSISSFSVSFGNAIICEMRSRLFRCLCLHQQMHWNALHSHKRLLTAVTHTLN